MKPVTTAALLAAVAALLAAPTALAGKPGNPGSPKNDKGKQTSASHTQSNQNVPDPGTALSKRKAYGFYCKNASQTHVAGQSGTAFTQCVNAMAKAATGQASTPKAACTGVGKQHGQCVAAAAKLLKDQHAHGITLDRKAILPRACNGAGATLLVNVHFTVTNEPADGTANTQWATETFHRTLKIWQEPDKSYCAVIGDTGSFVTVDAASPAGSGHVAAGITGRFQGGYVATFSGTAIASPSYATRGSLGSFDYSATPPPSFTSYFTVTTASYPAQGWIYRTAKNGTWVDQSSGSAGDITS